MPHIPRCRLGPLPTKPCMWLGVWLLVVLQERLAQVVEMDTWQHLTDRAKALARDHEDKAAKLHYQVRDTGLSYDHVMWCMLPYSTARSDVVR